MSEELKNFGVKSGVVVLTLIAACVMGGVLYLVGVPDTFIVVLIMILGGWLTYKYYAERMGR
jgi:hypothetical protein